MAHGQADVRGRERVKTVDGVVLLRGSQTACLAHRMGMDLKKGWQIREKTLARKTPNER
jgi:hypothetical protein